jgi:hypothetical protein
MNPPNASKPMRWLWRSSPTTSPAAWDGGFWIFRFEPDWVDRVRFALAGAWHRKGVSLTRRARKVLGSGP